MMKKGILLVSFLISFMVLSGQVMDANSGYEEPELYKGKVIEIVSEEDSDIETSGGTYGQVTQTVNVKILNKDRKGEIVEVKNYIDEIMAYSIEVEKGDDVYIFFETDQAGNEGEAHIQEFRRDKDLYILAAVFALLMIIVGGTKGVKSLITLSLTVAGIYYMMVGIVSGGNPVLLSVIVSFVVTLVTMFLVAGFNLKAVAGIIGTFGGVIIAGLIAIVVSRTSNLTGLGTTEAQMLMYSQNAVTLNIHGILFASILLGTLGAVMDVCMSIASAINEIKEANPYMGVAALFKSGMNIGRDVMGTMVNTLILAYVGSSVFLILIFMVNNVPMIDIINMDLVATEIMRAIAGTIGLICAIPLTAIVAAYLEKKKISY